MAGPTTNYLRRRQHGRPMTPKEAAAKERGEMSLGQKVIADFSSAAGLLCSVVLAPVVGVAVAFHEVKNAITGNGSGNAPQRPSERSMRKPNSYEYKK